MRDCSELKRVESKGVVLSGRGLAILVLMWLLCSSTAQAAVGDLFDTRDDRWSLLGGYGQSFPGWGDTTQRVATLDLVPRYDHVIFRNIGSGWYRGHHSIFIELPVSLVVHPDVSSMVGVNFLAAYIFEAGEKVAPYIFAGGGPVYNFADIPGMGADFNGNYQFGVGLKYPWKQKHDLLFELRYHHISNGGSEEPNEPLNSCKVMFGITF